MPNEALLKLPSKTDNCQVVFVQNSAHLAGAQKSLSRILEHPLIREFIPILLTSKEGWLTRFCTQKSVPWVQLPFPSPRCFSARFLGGNKYFARCAAELIKPLIDVNRPLIVHANDHPDSLIGLALAYELNAKSVLTLRTPAMTQRDFIKHGGLQQDLIIAVGNDLALRVRSWLHKQNLKLIYNGVTSEEIMIPIVAEERHSGCILVLGSMSPRKGWKDLVEALIILESRLPEIPLPTIHFLGDLLGKNPSAALPLNRLMRFQYKFLGVQEDYRDCLRQYPLAIHPSRSESFGMAALECVAAGVPLVAATTGMIPQFISNPAFLFPPNNPQAMAEILSPILIRPLSLNASEFNISNAQELIKSKFSTSTTAQRLRELYTSISESKA